MTVVRGVTWQHTRGVAPLAALAQVWNDRRPDERIAWDVRSLVSFGGESLDRLASEYDLIVLDYPFSGEALAAGWLTPIDELLSGQQIQDIARDAVGGCHRSFDVNGRLAALPIDAATQVTAYRPDLVAALGISLPRSLDEATELARRTRAVAMPLTPMAVWGALITICANVGVAPLQSKERAFDRLALIDALRRLSALARELDPICYSNSPIQVLNRMVATDEIAYCPLTYGYSVYGMTGYALHTLSFGDIAIDASLPPTGAILGGAGVGVSARSRRQRLAAEVAGWLASGTVQSTLFGLWGGQPAGRGAWDSLLLNDATNHFFANTRASMDACHRRPNMAGFHAFQNDSAKTLQQIVQSGAIDADALDTIDVRWRRLQQP